MGLFVKKKVEETISDKSEEYVLKEELETEVENIQKEFRIKQEELNEITQKIKTVKEEYNYIVSNLMVVKKEINQQKMELDVVSLEHRRISKKIKNFEQIKDSNDVSEFNKSEEDATDDDFEDQQVSQEIDQQNDHLEHTTEHRVKSSLIDLFA